MFEKINSICVFFASLATIIIAIITWSGLPDIKKEVKLVEQQLKLFNSKAHVVAGLSLDPILDLKKEKNDRIYKLNLSVFNRGEKETDEWSMQLFADSSVSFINLPDNIIIEKIKNCNFFTINRKNDRLHPFDEYFPFVIGSTSPDLKESFRVSFSPKVVSGSILFRTFTMAKNNDALLIIQDWSINDEGELKDDLVEIKNKDDFYKFKNLHTFNSCGGK